MVRPGVFILIICLIWPTITFAVEFTASVNRNQVAVGERLSLMLELSSASADGQPEVAALNEYFDVTPGGQSSKTSIINGNFLSSTRWQYILIPRKAGTITIPAISIQTSDGEAKSQSIELVVSKASSLPDADIEQNISISAKASKRDPYKNEPITYTITLVAQKTLANVQLSELKLDDAIIETIKAPAVYDRVFNGMAVKIIEATYRITPLKPGEITIPPIIVQGDVATRDRRSRFDSLLSDESDAFFDRLGAFGLTKLEPFRVASNDITLDVKPPVSQVKPWLPAESIQFSENWDSTQTFQVGEPITRSITIHGKGIAASQLPDLEKQLKNIQDFKVYADQPETKNSIESEMLTSWRKENYTLIPQQAGELTLPEITVSWWNVKENKLEDATIEARTAQVMPGEKNNQLTTPIAANTRTTTADKAESQTTPEITAEATQSATATNNDHTILYAVIVGLLVILLGVIAWVIHLQRKMMQLENTQSADISHELEKKDSNKPAINTKAFSEISSAAELQQYLQNYGEQHWHTPKNALLEAVLGSVKNLNPSVIQEADQVLKSLQDGLYSDKAIDIESTKQTCMILFAAKDQKNNKSKNKHSIEKLPDLNPS